MSSKIQNQKFIDKTDHKKVRIISERRINQYTSSLYPKVIGLRGQTYYLQTFGLAHNQL